MAYIDQMGQKLSNFSKDGDDLKNKEDNIFDKNIAVLTLKPIYIISQNELISDLSTGNTELDKIISKRIEQLDNYLSELLKNNLELNLITSIYNRNTIYLTIENSNGNLFDFESCKSIRSFFDLFNSQPDKLTIIDEDEAKLSLFYEDLGDVKLGFIVESIDYV
jgi:hypothetical protein